MLPFSVPAGDDYVECTLRINGTPVETINTPMLLEFFNDYIITFNNINRVVSTITSIEMEFTSNVSPPATTRIWRGNSGLVIFAFVPHGKKPIPIEIENNQINSSETEDAKLSDIMNQSLSESTTPGSSIADIMSQLLSNGFLEE